MTYDPNNIFAKILRGEAPAVKVYEDDHTFVMMDIMPQSEGHTLVLTKEPAVTIFEMTPDGVAACMKVTQRVAKAVSSSLAPNGVTICQFNGAAAGQTVPHVHFHVIPRNQNEPLRAHARDMADTAELENLAVRIKAALQTV